MASDKKPWTKARVLRAYREWQALHDHAEEVFALCQKFEAHIGDEESFVRLELPGWIGTGWPGDEFEVIYYGHDYYEADHPLRLSFEYLWSESWKEKLRKAQEARRHSIEGQRQEREERAQFERLKAKFDTEARDANG